MKLHLPTSLRKALLIVLCTAAAGVWNTAQGASRSDQLTRTTYCDFGDNKGQYAVHGVNDLLQHLRETQGISLTYLNENIDTYMWPENQPLINYDSRVDSGPAAGIGYNFIATVQHNGVIDPTFTGSTLGDSNAIHYAGIEYRSSTNNTFLLVPGIDYKVTRLSKIITDVTGSSVYTGDYPSLKGKAWYRSGSGTMYVVNPENRRQGEGGAYSYCIGGIMDITGASRNAQEGQVDVRGVVDDSGSIVINKWAWWQVDQINQNGHNPLPFVIQAGDSGSPTWIYDETAQSYLYAGAMQSGEGEYFSQARYAGQWTEAVMKYFNREVEMPDTGTIHIGVANVRADGHYDATNNVESRPYQGKVTDSDGNLLQTYLGLLTGNHTWKDLNDVQNNDNWYAYGNQYLNTGANLTYADLFETQDLVFKGDGGKTYGIELDGDVDLGLGYMRFMNEDRVAGQATYNLSNKAGVDARLDTAGFIVDAGVDLYMSLNGTSGHAREWRKIGDGNLHITGNGDNSDVLLNLGGSGTTYLERESGYAAYNVLANNGTTVVINDIGQIKRDFTFGYGGALLDMNGQGMTWNNDDTPDKAGFTIHALTDEAVISNSRQGTVSKLTWTQGGEREYLGSFADTKEGGVLQFVYNAQEDNSRLVLHSIYTCLGNADPVDGQKSGIFVESGTLALQGTNTLHAPGSLGANYSNARYFSEDDWHYADSATSVTVNGGTFELGHHARLTGDVTVNEGGTFLMREGVTHQFEYAEGGYVKLDTDSISEYYGLKGDVHLNEGGTMLVKFNDNADSALVYNGSIDGTGHLVVDSGIIGGLVVLGGDNTAFSGRKTLQRGGMHVTDLRALGSTGTADSKWNITNSGYLVLDTPFDNLSHDEVLQYVHADSDGILALTQDTTEAFDLSNHRKLIIGANQGEVVQYGSKDKELAAQMDDDGKMYWRLGGGGGELVVNFQLNDQAAQPTNLVLGADFAKGVVYLTNKNNFSGTITFKGGVTLRYDSDDALGNATFSINYTNRVMVPGGLDKVLTDSSGVLLVDQIANKNLDLTNHPDLAIGSQGNVSYQGEITVAQDAEYHFGGATGVLTVEKGLSAFGRNNLDVDGQTFSGGEILLNAAAAITGDVTVRGRNQAKASQILPETGNIVLGLGAANAIANAESVKLCEGGFLDLHGTIQMVKDLTIEAGGGVIDTSDSRNSILQVNMSKDLTWSGSVDAGAVFVSGEHTLTLAGSAYYDKMYLASGTTVKLGSDNALSAFGTTYVQKGSVLDANQKNTWGNVRVGGTLNANQAGFSGVVTLDGGTVNLKQGSLSADSTLISNGGRVLGKNAQINGMASFLSGTTTFSLDDPYAVADNDYARIAGTVDIAKDAYLVLEYGGLIPGVDMMSWKYSISSADFNVAESWVDEEGVEHKEEKGTLLIKAMSLYLDGVNQNFGGTVEVTGDHKVILYGEKGTKAFDRFLNAGETQLLRRHDADANWLLHQVDGSGTIMADTKTWVKIDGEGSFNGTFTKNAGTLELAHTNALAQAQVNLNNGATLAVSAETAKVTALNGSGKLLSGAAGDSESTRNTTLEITGDGGTFSGSVQGDARYGLSLRKTGTGTQTFSGAEIKLQNIEVQSGTLAFSNENKAPVVYGDVSIAQGATLDFAGKALSLAFGQELSIVSGGSGTATFQGNLQFSGGKMLFDSGILSADTAALKLTGTAGLSEGTNALMVNFSNDGLLENKTYLLSSGNWEALSGKVASDFLIYHSAQFNADSSGLSVSISERHDIQVWDGTPAQSEWNDVSFGQDENKLDSSKTAIFNDTAESQDVSIASDAVVREMVFDNNDKDYSLNAVAGAGVQADSLRQVGGANTDISGNIQVQTASVLAGSLGLGSGVSVGTVSVDEGATVVLKDTDAVTGAVSGAGTVRVDWGDGKNGSMSIGSINTVEVGSGVLDMSGKTDGSMEKLHVMQGGVFHIDARTDNYTAMGIVDKGGTLETVISDKDHSAATVTRLAGQGTVALINESRLDLGDNKVAGTKMDVSGFAGTIRMGSGADEMRFKSSGIQGIDRGVTIELNDKTQYWVDDNNGVVNANLILHGNSGTAANASWNNEGFGAVRAASTFNGDVTIDGNALVSGANSITFNATIRGKNEDDTLTFGFYRNGSASYSYNLSSGVDATALANMVVRKSANNKTTVNVNSSKGLAKNLQFAGETGENGIVNVNASNTIDRLDSAAGDGVVNILEGKSLEIANGAAFGGRLNLAQAATVASHLADGVVQLTGAAVFESTSVDTVAITGVDGTSLANACINLTSGTILKVNKVTMAGQSAITGADGARIETSLIDLAAGTRLEMANVTLGANSCITDDSAVLVANGLMVEADILSNLKPLTYGDAVPTQEEPAGMVSFTLSNIQDVVIEGKESGLVVCMVGSSSQALSRAEWLRLGLGEGDLRGEFADGLAVTLQYEDATGQQRSAQGVYSWEDVEVQAAVEAAAQNHDYVYFRLTGTVPEPATGTLSLLALAALASRRRRKA